MDVDKICFTVRRNVHWDCVIPIAGDPAAKSPEILGLPFQVALHGTGG